MASNTPDNDIPSVPVPPPGDAVGSVPSADAPDAAITPPPPAPVPPTPLEPTPVAGAPAAPAPAPYAAPGQPSPYATQGATPQPTAYTPVATGPVQTLSIVAMIAGIVGVLGSFIGLGFLPALASVILGHLAQKRQPWAKPFWITALITGYVGVGISLITGLVLLLAILAGIASTSN